MSPGFGAKHRIPKKINFTAEHKGEKFEFSQLPIKIRDCIFSLIRLTPNLGVKQIMRNIMNRCIKNCLLFGFPAVLFLLLTNCMPPEEIIIEIQVSPNVLNLASSGEVVTIHTNLSYSIVIRDQVYLNDVLIQSWKADNQGNFVAKFDIDSIKNLPNLVIDGYNTLALEGSLEDGKTFFGSQEIKVIDVKGQ